MKREIALLGNPNCGKTTLFNSLTGSNQYVGNWPGVTVEKKVGQVKQYDCTLVDLPGIYSLSPYSMEEIIARDYILNEQPQGIINIIDGTNIERNLYLTLQVLELNIPTVLAVNMIDAVEARGDKLFCERIEASLGIPVIPISAKRGKNIDKLIEQIIKKINKPGVHFIRYDPVTQKYLEKVKCFIREKKFVDFYAPKILESDSQCLALFSEQERIHFEAISLDYEREKNGIDREMALAESRYRLVEEIAKHGMKKNPEPKANISEKIDAVVLNRFCALPVFMGLMFFIFFVTFSGIGTGMQNGMEVLLERLIRLPLQSVFLANNMPDWIHSLFLDGVFNGVSSVLSFLPQILILFLCLSLLEDSGYMARAAFMMDCLLEKIGLSGKAFIPMLMGFGCTTPAVMAARTMENEKDRRLTVLLIPFMSCGAKLPIYALFTGVFFSQHRGLILFNLYFLGLVTAIFCGLFLKKTVFQTSRAPFVMELPPYRIPGIQSTVYLLWDKAKGFLIKAGTIIFSMSVVIWLMQNFDWNFQFVSERSRSILGWLGSVIAPVLSPLGFGNWQAGVALLSGLVAKESVVSSLTVLYGGDLTHAVAQNFTAMGAYSFMVFCLLYVPCISAFVTMARELKSKRWVVFGFLFQMSVAYGMTFFIYQIGSFFFGR